MNEEFYLALIEELTRVRDIGGAVGETKTFKFNDKDITYSVEMQHIDNIRIKINKTVLIYNNGVYSYHYSPDVDKDIKETIDAAVTEFYKFNAKI